MEKSQMHGRRKFYEIPISSKHSSEKSNEEDEKSVSDTAYSENAAGDKSKILKFIFEDIIGKDSSFIGSFGKRRVVYCDFIASGRALGTIETYLTRNVMPIYGNTHTTTTVTSLQSSMFMNESRYKISYFIDSNVINLVICFILGVFFVGVFDDLASMFYFCPILFIDPPAISLRDDTQAIQIPTKSMSYL